ncbi:MAG: fasciclin domain-containing protein [Microcoleus sp. SIO2G3]|nr:fasciclin domain-containing protein [Microcoleus sp. SIO2G3]
MKSRKLLVGILGMSAFISLPAFATQNNQLERSSSGTSVYTADVTPASPAPEAQTDTTPGSSLEPAPQVAPPAAAPASPEASSASDNIVEAATDQFKTLAKAIEAADLAETLSSEGPYTVFAPTDEAFAALPEGVLEQLLLPENKAILVQLLSYHVVPGAVTSSQIQPGEVETLAGESLAVQLATDGTVAVNNAKVTQADIQASNGVIHAVDQVILPRQALLELGVPQQVTQNKN